MSVASQKLGRQATPAGPWPLGAALWIGAGLAAVNFGCTESATSGEGTTDGATEHFDASDDVDEVGDDGSGAPDVAAALDGVVTSETADDDSGSNDGGDDDEADGDDGGGDDGSGVDPGPPSPLTAKGKWTDLSAAISVKVPVDAGLAGTNTPLASAGLVIDLDGDKIIDLVLTDGISQVWIGKGMGKWKWSFKKVHETKAPGIMSLAAIDRGGGPLSVVVGGSKIALLEYGSGGWKDVAQEAGLTFSEQATAQAIVPVDLDMDGHLDLLVGQYSCDDQARVKAYINQTNGKFIERGALLGLAQQATLWALLATDMDDDGRTDVLTLAEGCVDGSASIWYRNKGFGPGTSLYKYTKLPPLFVAPSMEGGTPMGGAVADFNGDGHLDYVFSEVGYRQHRMAGMDMTNPNLEVLAKDAAGGNHLLIGKGGGKFVSAAVPAGITTALSETGLTMVSWSMRFVDFDHDGHMDLMVSHGYDYAAFLLADDGGMRPVLFRNRGDATFEDVSAKFGMPSNHLGLAMASVDIDGDGDLDFFLGGQTVAPILLRNDVVHDGHDLSVTLRGVVSNPWGLGSRLWLQTSARTLVAEMSTQAPSGTMDAPVVHFALMKGETPTHLKVRWPSAFVQEVEVGADAKSLKVVEPKLVSLNKTWVSDGQVTVLARGYSDSGEYLPGQVPITIELAQGAKGSWDGPIECMPNGECFRQWQAPSLTGSKGEDAIVVTIDGLELGIRPRVRFDKSSWQP